MMLEIELCPFRQGHSDDTHGTLCEGALDGAHPGQQVVDAGAMVVQEPASKRLLYYTARRCKRLHFTAYLKPREAKELTGKDY